MQNGNLFIPEKILANLVFNYINDMLIELGYYFEKRNYSGKDKMWCIHQGTSYYGVLIDDHLYNIINFVIKNYIDYDQLEMESIDLKTLVKELFDKNFPVNYEYTCRKYLNETATKTALRKDFQDYQMRKN